MPSRDYARSKSKKVSGKKTSLILALIISLLVAAGAGLWLLKEQAPVSSAPTAPTSAAPTSSAKSTLPSRPEEVYSYIRDLETREVPVDKDSKFSQLTKEQEQQILKRQEEERRRLEQTIAPQPTMPEVATTAQTAPQEETVAQKAPEVQQTEVKKQQEAEKAKAAQQAQTQPKANVAEAQKPSGKFGLQCGAFKNKAQAENMQARLAMAGYNARIVTNAEWNRVFVGPIGDRAAANKAQSNAKSVAECLVVSM